MTRRQNNKRQYQQYQQTRDSTGYVHGFVPDTYKPKKHRFPNGTMLTVKCPHCGAEPGEHCTTDTGNIRMQCHRPRRHIALRKYWNQQDTTEMPPT